MNRIFARLFGRIAASGSYESANHSRSRGQVPGAAPTDTKKELSSHTRREIVRRHRYLAKNSGFTREMVADMAIYSTGDGIRPQAQSADEAWNKEAEALFARWAAMPEITRRFSFEECQTLVCRAIDTDGEVFALKVRDAAKRPCIQLLESHRVGDAGLGEGGSDGILFDTYGAPRAYRVIQDDGTTRDVPANAVMHVFEPESPSGIRSVPALQHSVNHMLDELELLALEKQAVKDNAQISRVLKVDGGNLADTGDFALDSGPAGTPEQSDPVLVQKIVGGKVVGLKPHESMDTHQPNRPSPVFTGFLEHLRRDSASGVLPYEFAMDSSKIGGAGVRLVVAKADRRFSYRQLILIQRFLRPVWGYVIGDAIERGELAAVPDWTRVAWVCPRRVTVDAGREAQQNRADVETGLKTLSDHYSELGMDFREELERRAQDAKAIMETAARYGVPVEMLYRPSGMQSMATPNAPVDKPASA